MRRRANKASMVILSIKEGDQAKGNLVAVSEHRTATLARTLQ